MKRKLLPFLMMVLVAIMGSCVGDDIDSLQDQINDLDDKVAELEKTQQEALLAEIAKLQATITTLQEAMEAGDSDLASQYDALLNNLTLLEEEVANNKDAVYYGNLITDEDFAAFMAQGATIVTGKIIATSQAHIDALGALKLVGGNLSIFGGTAVELINLQTVSGSLMVEGVNEENASINLPALASIGDELWVSENEGLTSLNVNALILVNAYASIVSNMMLADLNLGNVNFNDDVFISSGLKGTLTLGQINGTLQLMYTGITNVVVNSTVIGGDLYMSGNGALEAYDMDKITEIKGNLTMESNGVWGATDTEFAAFAGLTTIVGNVMISYNYVPVIESFNAVTSVQGNSIGIYGDSYSQVSVFNNLLFDNTRHSIDINVRTDWFNGFNALSNANILNLTLEGNSKFDEVTGETTITPNKVNGFSSLVDCKGITLKVPDVFEFDAFNVFDNFWSAWGKYCHIYVPLDTDVDLCSMQPVLNKIAAGDFGTAVEVKFYEGWMELTDPAADIINNRLIDGCN
ncbi:hypothetical protein KEM09_05060 [Carboxylicivirga mesophila]|uniref:Receptor L-domain domain-containing protein n=1 Tax=Carboxylicivirga mesophila TaxID=1166478 RepID=A0ABS5K6Z2_9BACT|nr:hypothetical protein [Carboxylicivirga mesophila]MBS2210755.1 hypothetical protein [Carboxylicivirga mesophila]